MQHPAPGLNMLQVALCNPYSFSRASCRDSSGSALRFYMVYKENDADSTGTKLTGAITNAAAMVGMMVVVTFMMFFRYKYRCEQRTRKRECHR